MIRTRVQERNVQRPVPIWLLAAGTFLLHATVVLALIQIRNLSSTVAISQLARVMLELGDFWVYRWVNLWLNTPVLAEPMFRVFDFLRFTSLTGFLTFWELCVTSICGGLVWAGIVAAWFRWRRATHHRRLLRSAAV
jgi:hypothetical protein